MNTNRLSAKASPVLRGLAMLTLYPLFPKMVASMSLMASKSAQLIMVLAQKNNS